MEVLEGVQSLPPVHRRILPASKPAPPGIFYVKYRKLLPAWEVRSTCDQTCTDATTVVHCVVPVSCSGGVSCGADSTRVSQHRYSFIWLLCVCDGGVTGGVRHGARCSDDWRYSR